MSTEPEADMLSINELAYFTLALNEPDSYIRQSADGTMIHISGYMFPFKQLMGTLREVFSQPQQARAPYVEEVEFYVREDKTKVPFDQLSREELLNAIQSYRIALTVVRAHRKMLEKRCACERSNVIREIAAAVAAMAETG